MLPHEAAITITLTSGIAFAAIARILPKAAPSGVIFGIVAAELVFAALLSAMGVTKS